jgi:hypothetical protein
LKLVKSLPNTALQMDGSGRGLLIGLPERVGLGEQWHRAKQQAERENGSDRESLMIIFDEEQQGSQGFLPARWV